MILYFDSYITDIPLKGRDRRSLKEDIRKKSNIYKAPKRLDVAKYTLASYAQVKWSNVLIRYELDNVQEYPSVDKFIRDLYPNAVIMHTRSANQLEYKKSLKLLEKMGDEWIFYAPNNDHPLLYSADNVNSYLEKLISLAKKLISDKNYASIMYSHFSEFLNIPINGTPENFLHGKNTKILEDTSLARIYSMPHGDFSSVQIVHLSLLKHWFGSKKLTTKRIIRQEDVKGEIKVLDQIIIVPKKELCAHFDGYEHMLGQPNEICTDLVPPLFIPPGFFTKNIRISYGYSEYRNGWVNINPCAKKYSFRDPVEGTDLKISMNDIPYFWRSRIKEIKVNKSASSRLLHECTMKNNIVKINPWRLTYQSINYSSLVCWVRFHFFKHRVNSRIVLSTIKKRLKL